MLDAFQETLAMGNEEKKNKRFKMRSEVDSFSGIFYFSFLLFIHFSGKLMSQNESKRYLGFILRILYIVEIHDCYGRHIIKALKP